jgi:hypothetical protein
MRGAYVGAWDDGTLALRRHERLVWLLAIGASELYVVVQLVLAASRPEADRLLLGGLFGCAAILLVAMATSRAALSHVAAVPRGRRPEPTDDPEALRHELLSRLSLAVGYCALVAADPRLPEDLRALLLAARGGAEEAAEAARHLPRRPGGLLGAMRRLLPPRRPLDRWD